MGVNKFTVYVFNVDAGDNILIELPNGEFGLIDFYFRAKLNQRKPPSVAFLEKRNKIKKVVISFCCISHYDFDHLHGMNFFWDWCKHENIEVKNVWLTGATESNVSLVNTLKKAQQEQKIALPAAEKARVEVILRNVRAFLKDLSANVVAWKQKTGRTVQYIHNIATIDNGLADDIKAFSIAPLDRHIQQYEEKILEKFFMQLYPVELRRHQTNNNIVSSIIFFQNRHFTWVFGGDAPKKVWHDAIDENITRKFGFELASDFVKVSHHGSKTSSSLRIWKELTKGKQKVHFGISAGENNHHPHSKTIKEIEKSSGPQTPFIWSTNICEKCVGLPCDEHSIFVTEVNSATHLFFNDRSDIYKRSANDRTGGFLGYRFDYDLDQKKESVTKLKDWGMPGRSNCLFAQIETDSTKCRICASDSPKK